MPDTITPDVCKLHREVIDAKIETLTQKDRALDARMAGIEDGIKMVRDLQTKILYAIIVMAFGTICTLIGVLYGRGLDLGWIIP